MRALLAALSLAFLSSTAFAQKAPPQYTSLWSLGDSLSDVGRTFAATDHWYTPTYPKGPLYYNGHFSNGQVWVEYLSKLDNLPYNASQNLAWGGAVTGTAYSNLLSLIVTHLESQVTQFQDRVTGTSGFLGIGGTARDPASSYGSKPLVTFWIGGNNFRQQIEDTGITTLSITGWRSSMRTPHDTILSNVPDDLRKINNTLSGRSDIAQSGVTYYVPTVADVSTTPKFSTLPTDERSLLSATVKETNRDLKNVLYNLGDEFASGNPNTRIVVIDTAALLGEVQANPTSFGFKDATHACVDADSGKYMGSCSAATVTDYLFWDEFHPTTKAHEMIAKYAQNTDLLEYGSDVTLTQPYVANIEIRDRAYAGGIGGTGSMIKQGEATLTLSGNNTYAGGTRVDQGFVKVASDGNLGARSGLLTLQGGGVWASSSFTMQRNVQVTNEGTFQTDRNVTLTLANNTLSGDGALRKTGAGMLDLRSTMDTSANGQTVATAGVGRQLTSVLEGTLKINTTNPYATYRMETAQGTVLGGSGTIITGKANAGGGVVASGQISPGNSIGTLTIDGDLTLANSSAYNLEVDTNRADRLVVTGNLAVDGNVSILTDPTDKITSQAFTLASSGGTLSGRYDEVLDLSPFLSETLSYGGNSVSVTFNRNFAAPAITANQQAVAAHLNAAYLTVSQGDLDNVFYGLDTTITNAAGANALDQLSGASTGNLMTSSAIQNGQFTRALEDRMAARRAGRDNGTVGASTGALSFGQDNSGLGTALAGSVAATGTQASPGDGRDRNGVSAWARVLGGPANIGGAGAYDMTGVGVLLGVDKSFGNGLAGLSLGYGSFNNDGGNGGNGSADTYQVSVYGSMQMGKLFLDGTLSYAYADYATTRTLGFGDLYRVASGSSDGNDVSLSLKAGTAFGIGNLAFEPSVGFDWYYLTRSAFTESNAGSAGLTVGSQTLDLVMPSVGLRIANPFNTGSFTITPEASARYYYNFGDTGVATTAGLIGAPAAPFTVESTGLGRSIGLLAAGISAQQYDNLRVSAQYELQLSNDVTAQVFSMGLRYTW